MMTEQRKFIEQSKRLHDSAQISSLILKDDSIDATTPKIILEILVSQYATALNDSCLMNMCSEPQQYHHKLPLPIVFAIFKQQISSGHMNEALKLLQLHVDRKSLEKVYILIYNLTKIYEQQKEYSKQSFYLQTLLKEAPFFPEAAHDLAITYAFHLNRLEQAIILLQRHLNSVNSNNPLIQAAYLRCISISTTDVMENVKILQNKNLSLTNYYNLGLLFRKKGIFVRASQILSEIIHKIESHFIEMSQQDSKILLLAKINLINIRQDQKRFNEASILAQILLEADSNELDPQSKLKILQISENKKAKFHQFAKENSQKRNQLFKIPSKRKNFESSTSAMKKQNSLIQNMFLEIKEKNDKKFKHLLTKQKSIDKFFKNITMKFSPNSQTIEINLKNSLKVARQELSTLPKDLTQNEYIHLEDEFQKSRLLHCSELQGCDIQQSIRTILLNLQNLKHGGQQHFKTEILGCSPSVTSFQKSDKNSIRKNIHTSSVSKRFNLTIKKHQRQPKDRQNVKFRIKNYVESPPLRKPNHIEKVKAKKIQKQSISSDFLSLPINNIFVKDPKKQYKNIEDEPLKHFNNRQKQRKSMDTVVIKQSEKLISDKQISNKQIKEQNINGEEISVKQICEKDESQKDIKKESPFLHQNKVEVQNVEIQRPQNYLSLEQNENKITHITQKLTQEDKQTQRLFEDKCLQESQKNIRIKNISFKDIQQVQQVEKIEQSKKKSFKKIDTTKTSLKKIDLNKLSQRKIQTLISQKKIDFKTFHEDKSCQKIENSTQQNKDNNKQITRSINSSPRQSSEFNVFEDTNSEDKGVYNMMASSFNLNTASLQSFKNKPFKKSKLAGESTFAKAMEGLTPEIKKKQTSTMSTEFHVQMLKVAELERKQNWEKAYKKLLEIYKNFKKDEEKIETLLRIGNIFEKQEKFCEAEKTYLKCSKFNSADAFLSLGNLQLKIGKIEQGVENLEKANCIRRFDIAIENKLVYGYSLREETMDKALKLAHCILKKQPNSLQTLLITAGILEKQGLIEEAIQIVKAIDNIRQTEHIKHYLGILHLASSNLKEAFDYFKQALAIKPDYAPSLVETASIISQNYPKQAIAILNKALQLSPGNKRALARLGKIYEAELDFDNAMATYKAGLQTQVNYESYMKIGDCLAKKQSYIEALLNYKEASNLKKTSDVFFKLAVMYEHKNEHNKAIQNYQSALTVLQPSQESARRSYLMAIGRLQLKMGQYQTAIATLDQLLETTQTFELFKLLGDAYFGNKQYNQSLGFFEKANILSGGSNYEAMENMAMCLDRLQQYLASKALYEKILEKNPNNVRCLNNLANIMLITGQTNEAFFLFESILEKAPKNIEKRLKLADIYAEVGDWSKVEYHLIQCYRQKEHDPRIIEKLVVLYKEKRDNKMAAKYEKKLALLKTSNKHKLN